MNDQPTHNSRAKPVSVVIPAYNEVEGIIETVNEVAGTLARMDIGEYEIVVVDDGSTDGTGGILDKIEKVRVVRHPHNVGYGRSLKSGIAAARFDTIVITDADLSYPFSESVPGLVAAYQDGFDMVVGARSGDHYQSSPLKSPLRTLLKWLVEYTSGRRIPDINSGLRVFDRKMAMSYFAHLCDTFSFTTSMTLSYMMTGRFVGYRSIPYRARRGKTKVRLLKDSLRTLQYIVQAIIYYNPLKIFLLMTVIALIASVAGFIGSIAFHLLAGYILGIGGIILAFLMFAFGLLAVLLKQIMDK
jgi:glycosyltransferase involved in cell wall biosynthesis